MVQNPSFYVGIDLGTHQSGFSTATLGSSARFMEIYPDQPVPYCKTLSMILYSKELSPDWQPVAWGWSAYAEYQRVPAEHQDEFLLLERQVTQDWLDWTACMQCASSFDENDDCKEHKCRDANVCIDP